MGSATDTLETDMRRPRMTTLLATAAVIFVAIQLVPYGRDHTNPPVKMEPSWDSAQTRELAVRACYDCHSNETRWPWYSHVAPVSWMVAYDVQEGRSVLNLSEMNRPQEEAAESAETVQEGEMPPMLYLPTHPEARLTPSERASLIAGLQATLGGPGTGGTEAAGDEDD